MRKYPRILYFIVGPVPTPEDYDDAEAFGPNCVFRNASLAEDDSGAMEICDGCAGKVPQRYADLRPTAEAALEAWRKTETERRMRVAAGLSDAPNADATTKPAPAVRTTPPADDKAIADGKQAAKGTTATTPATTPAPAAASAWKAN